MRRTLIAFALLAAACGGAAEPDATTASTAPASTTASTAAVSTTTATVVASSTTTTISQDVAAGGTLGSVLLSQVDESEIESGRFEAIIEVTPGEEAEFDAPVLMTMTGAFAANGDSEFSMDFGDLFAATGELDEMPAEFVDAFAEPMQMRTVGDYSYVKGGFMALFLGTDLWLESPAEEQAIDATGFDLGVDGDPTELLDALAGANADVTVVGEVELNGVSTTHYVVTLDLATLAETLSEEERAELEADFGDVELPEFPLEIWIGDDGRIHRFVLELGADALGEDSAELGAMRMEFNMWDFGADIVIEAPPPDEVATEDDLDFGFGDA